MISNLGDGFRLWLGRSWWVAYLGTLIIVSRLLYERIILAPRYGPQIGLEFIHMHPEIFIPAVLCFFFSHLWLLITLLLFVISPGRPYRGLWLKSGLMIITLVIFYTVFGLLGETG
jgi:hypothetical protein